MKTKIAAAQIVQLDNQNGTTHEPDPTPSQDEKVNPKTLKGQSGMTSGLDLLHSLIQKVAPDTRVLLLPGGFFDSGYAKPDQLIAEIDQKIPKILKEEGKNLVVVLGIDGQNMDDQLQVAYDQTGRIATARKFHNVGTENLAKGPFETEMGQHRTISVDGKSMYMAVCYDVRGVRDHKEFIRKYGVILNSVHYLNTGGGSVDFARKLYGGASQFSRSTVIGAAFFSDNLKKENWASGIFVPDSQLKTGIRNLKYADIKLKPKTQLIGSKDLNGNYDVALHYYDV